MSDYRPLPPKVAESLGHLLHAGIWANPKFVALSEDTGVIRIRRADLENHLARARRMAAAAERTDLDTYFDKIGL